MSENRLKGRFSKRNKLKPKTLNYFIENELSSSFTSSKKSVIQGKSLLYC